MVSIKGPVVGRLYCRKGVYHLIICNTSMLNLFQKNINMYFHFLSFFFIISEIDEISQQGWHSWYHSYPWWRHQMETSSALLAIYAGNSPVPREFPAQRPVTRSFDVCFALHLNNRLSKQSWGWWLETPSASLWRHVMQWLGNTRSQYISSHGFDLVCPEYSSFWHQKCNYFTT